MRICVIALKILRELALNGYVKQIIHPNVFNSVLEIIQEKFHEDQFLHKVAFELLNTVVQKVPLCILSLESEHGLCKFAIDSMIRFGAKP